MASASQADSGEFDSRHLLQKRRLPCEGVLFWRKTTTDESRGWSCERERAFCPIGIFFRNTPRQNKQHSVLFGGARRQRRDSRHLLQKRRLPCEGVLFWRKTTTDESRGWSCERERAFCPIGIFFRNTPRQNKQHSVLFGGARRQRRDSRHLLQKRRLPCEGVLFWRKTTISLLGSLVQRELAAIWQTEGLAVSVSELLIPSVTS